ncbi:MAG: hypothetical protein U0804_09150 [Gemmataceae bacterium]
MSPTAPAAPSSPSPTTAMAYGYLECEGGRVQVGVANFAFIPSAVLPGFVAECDSQPVDVGVPAVVFDHRGPEDGLGGVLKRVGAYLNTGVPAVVILAARSRAAGIFNQAEGFVRQVNDGDELTLPDVLPGFAVPVRRLFE